ncbi:hypothetical protein BS47DRAFT_1384140 [Hydnum rufescens UP504]|uniref:F-box domain-containing protein n=1 Tax=Hydnum rufescens UP504 TaxID=1448309 RepID=A0A9P6ARE2_9AGAM|nr:hypothetical protein BS47DRAFT_1384140 [Hydnum rufescens UP504]
MVLGKAVRRRHFELPFDVLCEIIAWADRPSLHELSVLNHECHHQVNKHLWRTLVLRGDDGALSFGAEMILGNACRAQCVREMTIMFSDCEAYERKSYFHATLDQICRSPQHTPFLQKLDIRVDESYSDVARMLSDYDFPFELEAFCTNLYYSDGLGGFLLKHPEIRDFTQYTRRSLPQSMSPELLPRIRTLSYPMVGIVDMVRGRPVARMVLDLRSDENLADGLQAISVSSADVLDLKVVIHISTILQPFLESLVIRAPSLKNLTIKLQNYAAFCELQHDTHLSTLRGIKAHPTLQSICWRGVLVPPNLRNPALYCGPALRKLEIFAMRPQFLFERVGDGRNGSIPCQK